MNAFPLTAHATVRMAQRGIRMTESDLIAQFGTPVDGGFLFRDEDCQALESNLKMWLDRISRLRGKRLVVANGRIVTAYHATKRQRRRLLRYAHERDLDDRYLMPRYRHRKRREPPIGRVEVAEEY